MDDQVVVGLVAAAVIVLVGVVTLSQKQRTDQRDDTMRRREDRTRVSTTPMTEADRVVARRLQEEDQRAREKREQQKREDDSLIRALPEYAQQFLELRAADGYSNARQIIINRDGRAETRAAWHIMYAVTGAFYDSDITTEYCIVSTGEIVAKSSDPRSSHSGEFRVIARNSAIARALKRVIDKETGPQVLGNLPRDQILYWKPPRR